MTNYLQIIGHYFPTYQVEDRGNDPTNYANIIWTRNQTPIPQATLDQYANLTQTAATSNVDYSVSVYNDTNATILAGTAIYFSGTETLSGFPKILTADKSLVNINECAGFVKTDILSKSAGEITYQGLFPYNTSNFNVGDDIYVGSTGAVTNVKPTLSYYQKVGYVYSKAANGQIYIDLNSTIDNGSRTMDLVFCDNTGTYIRKQTNTYSVATRFIWKGTTALGNPATAKLIAWSESGSSTNYARLVDVNTGSTIVEINTLAQTTTPKIFDFGSFTMPSSETMIELQLKSSNSKYIYVSGLSFYF